ncbi:MULTISPECIES: LytR/AlgR family response regulator transcription factor [Flavobacterium]|uniref:Response regulator transcription factor n=2 Tax=Flavobacterium TaxID=237 RepID=A0AA94F140_9FLAO|nr:MULTISPECIES: LytTR family DNA-binding domain-containing protein [Flavobacterium]OXA83200.1 DNA-binding response regulator [Flavobacterium columnare NBRC 100251 = ATCC 23463]AMA47989.1 LytR family transcriptional regulator [Flavobacterium covae]MCH4829886.1 response regulator transcription factor [Flavobacterium columnare]MCH4832734.1 response regulator transcription factor [Flavobacterium columnare]MCJ1807759.1 LytTR family DNA-binding domain-containing protein [Flavobacterium covae]
MNCIIVDDETLARTIIYQMVSNYSEMNIVEEFSNAIQAMKYLNQNSVDLIFLDIHMPDFTGFDFIQTVKNPPKIILITSDKNYAIEAFEYDCIVDYIVKPITQARLDKAIQKFKSSSIKQENPITKAENSILIQNESNDFYINIDRRLIKINFQSINLIEAKGDYIIIKTEHKNYTVHSTLKKIQDKLPQSLFLKVHRSYIINVKKIIDIEDNSVLIGKEVIPVSRSNRPELINRLNLL